MLKPTEIIISARSRKMQESCSGFQRYVYEALIILSQAAVARFKNEKALNIKVTKLERKIYQLELHKGEIQ